MDEKKLFDGFEEFEHAQYANEAKQRWGHTDAYRESQRRTRSYSKDDWLRIKTEGAAITQGLAALLAQGRSSSDPAAMRLAEEHRLHIDRWFYPCSYEMHMALGEMYLADPRFTETYERAGVGLAQYVRDAIHANAARQNKEQG